MFFAGENLENPLQLSALLSFDSAIDGANCPITTGMTRSVSITGSVTDAQIRAADSQSEKRHYYCYDFMHNASLWGVVSKSFHISFSNYTRYFI